MKLRSNRVIEEKSNSFIQFTVVPKMADKINFVSFDPEGGMKVEKWLKYFNNLSDSNDLDDTWKLNNISKYLKGTALTLYVNECLDCTNYDEISTKLIEYFTKFNVVNFFDFSNLKLGTLNNLENYFHKKLDYGRILKLSENLIIQGLTDGLPNEYKNILIVKSPTTALEWYKIVSQLVPNSINNSQRSSFSEFNANKNSHMPQTSRINNNPRFVTPRLPNNSNRQELPPRPCRICTNRGIFNAFHWERDCSFKGATQTSQTNVKQFA